MPREDFNDLLWFLAVAEDRSFTKAAAKLGITQSTLSHTIKRLENRLGLRLFTRTTRSVSLTEAGDRLYYALLPSIRDIRGQLEALSDLRDKPSGTVRITLSDHALETVAWPKLEPVLKAYPEIRVELSRDNGLRNIVEDGFDAGVRLGESIEKDMIAVRIGSDWRMLVVASPDYLAEKSVPQHPQDLLGHNCINMRQATAGGLYTWEFEKAGQELRVRVAGQLTFNSSYPMVQAAVKGLGIAFVPEDLVGIQLASGALLTLLDDWTPPFPGYYLYYPSRHQNSPAFRVVVDALRQR
ncbi:LysR family transcriptional regulator [Pararhizobium antarcticum]|uniref:HTH-type transcriptional regulator TtuA n=1 Tax=Pararhizobium antarcticum TaxID=1798805 RepID=A0A657LKC1_9HYPH|nr:LysR family transcriptional regulator [Pararhizobium antarcticum]OJF90241.1 LysR family transcriptional regulator [Pararhizobium antarcticum]